MINEVTNQETRSLYYYRRRFSYYEDEARCLSERIAVVLNNSDDGVVMKGE